MYLIFLALWIIFNGKVTLEIVLFGLVIAAALDFFVIKFMDYRPQTTLKAIRLLPQMLLYFLVLLREIFKANIQTTKLLYSAKYEVEPLLVTFRPGLKTDTARVVLATSLTLTPGTITVTLEGDEFVVHCLDKELADGIENSVFVALLRRMEGMV